MNRHIENTNRAQIWNYSLRSNKTLRIRESTNSIFKNIDANVVDPPPPPPPARLTPPPPNACPHTHTHAAVTPVMLASLSWAGYYRSQLFAFRLRSICPTLVGYVYIVEWLLTSKNIQGERVISRGIDSVKGRTSFPTLPIHLLLPLSILPTYLHPPPPPPAIYVFAFSFSKWVGWSRAVGFCAALSELYQALFNSLKLPRGRKLWCKGTTPPLKLKLQPP